MVDDWNPYKIAKWKSFPYARSSYGQLSCYYFVKWWSTKLLSQPNGCFEIFKLRTDFVFCRSSVYKARNFSDSINRISYSLDLGNIRIRFEAIQSHSIAELIFFPSHSKEISSHSKKELRMKVIHVYLRDYLRNSEDFYVFLLNCERFPSDYNKLFILHDIRRNMGIMRKIITLKRRLISH